MKSMLKCEKSQKLRSSLALEVFRDFGDLAVSELPSCETGLNGRDSAAARARRSSDDGDPRMKFNTSAPLRTSSRFRKPESTLEAFGILSDSEGPADWLEEGPAGEDESPLPGSLIRGIAAQGN